MNKIFEINMTWVKTLILAIACGVLTGVIMQIPALEDTSIHNIGVTMEFWVLMGMVIAVNCEKWWEAGLKTFVFFLVSQPLVYLVMWPVYQCFPWHYYMYWFYWTVACLPMGILAWYIKKGNIASFLILAVVCVFLCFFADNFLYKTIVSHQWQLLASLFCFGQVALYIATLLEGAKKRMLLGAVCAIFAAALFFSMLASGPNVACGSTLDHADQYTVSIEDESIAVLESATDSGFSLRAKGYGETVATFTAPDGTQLRYDVIVNANTGSMEILPQDGSDAQ